LKYRDVEYTVVQGIGRQLWKWGFALEGKAVTGQGATKAEAVAETERAIDRALGPNKLKLVRPDTPSAGASSPRGQSMEFREARVDQPPKRQ